MINIIRRVSLVASLVFMPVLALSAHAQSNFQITPPPIAAPDFEAGKVDDKVGLTYISMSGQGMSLTGFGADFIRRKAITDAFAWDWQAGMFKLDGKLSGKNMSLFSLPLSLNIEYQPLKTPTSSAILFAGGNYSMSSVTVDKAVLYIGGTYWDLNLDIITHGWQIGGQYTAQLSDFKLSPFVMIQSESGTVKTSYGALNQGSSSIPTFTTTSYGLDLLYIPWNVTLSSVLQEAAKSGSNSSVKTTLFTLNYTF